MIILEEFIFFNPNT